MDINIERIRKDFPILHQDIGDNRLIYFDNAATSQKPAVVINTLDVYYRILNSNIHRAAHYLANESTEAFENSRKKIQKFINAKHSHEVILTKGTTESINLVASSFGKKFIDKGDEIIISTMEHHSNIVPWQMVCEERQAKLKVIPINEKGEIDIEAFQKLISPKTKLVAISHISNVLGSINPIKEIIEKAHQHNIAVLVDGAQAIPHMQVDVQQLNCDFYCFSSHKAYGPTGVGVLYGKKELLNELPPYQGGGEMISKVTFERTTYNKLPYKFEAGTPNVAAVIAFGAAIDYLNSIGMSNIAKHESHLLKYATDKLKNIDGLSIIGNADNKASIISFLIDGIHPFDIGDALDKHGIAIRTGHNCAEPLMKSMNIEGVARASFAFYNTTDEIDVFIECLEKIKKMFV